jgi:hypothetical protein
MGWRMVFKDIAKHWINGSPNLFIALHKRIGDALDINSNDLGLRVEQVDPPPLYPEVLPNCIHEVEPELALILSIGKPVKQVMQRVSH